jgi:hypothetical protein
MALNCSDSRQLVRGLDVLIIAWNFGPAWSLGCEFSYGFGLGIYPGHRRSPTTNHFLSG